MPDAYKQNKKFFALFFFFFYISQGGGAGWDEGKLALVAILLLTFLLTSACFIYTSALLRSHNPRGAQQWVGRIWYLRWT